MADEPVGHSVSHNVVPSTCFATTNAHWRHFGATRSQPLGNVDLCKPYVEEDGWRVFPAVPRAKDIGRLHENGYSVLVYTRDGVRKRQNTDLTSDDLPAPGQTAPAVSLYAGNTRPLFMLLEMPQGWKAVQEGQGLCPWTPPKGKAL